ncbi:MAG: AAA family ATPase [Candidatus Thermoplasmatota archaeon]|jgi:circadian clock protein KaiC|nr:AAA family ATPase [Candidatus Thermoplasmatota archaeon]
MLIRLSTGIAGLDKMMNGGLIAQRPYIVTGDEGSGKTILALQFMLEGIKKGENVLYVAIDEPPSEIKENAKVFGWDLSNFVILDATPEISSLKKSKHVQEVRALGDVKVMKDIDEIKKSSSENPYELSIQSIYVKLSKELERVKYHRVVVDSLTALRLFAFRNSSLNAERVELQSFLRFLSESETTSLLITSIPREDDIPAEFVLSRGEIRLFKQRVGGEIRRGIAVMRYRGSAHDTSIRPFAITSKGIEVYTQ